MRKPHAGRLRVALAFPNTYWVGMSNLGFQTVYRLFNGLDDVVCERVFLPGRSELAAALERPGSLTTVESGTPVRDFDVFAFSVSFEWDYTNVVSLLRLAGLPLYAAERSARHPLVVIGGAVTFVNPEPLAPFADVVAAGEGEVLVPALVREIGAAADRDGLLEALARERGFYVPVARARAVRRRRHHRGLRAGAGVRRRPCRCARPRWPRRPAPTRHRPSSSPPTPNSASRLLVEVVRGCANLCRFCWAGYNYLPVRAFPADRILAIARAARAHASRIGLVSIALCDHPEIDRLLTRAARDGLLDQPGLASARRPDRAHRPHRSARAASDRSRSRPRPAPIASGA